VYWGHIHWYERFWPIAPGGKPESSYINPTAPIYILPAAPGNIEGLTPGNITNPYTAFISNDRNGLGLLTVINQTTLQWNYYASITQELLDTITVVKQHQTENSDIEELTALNS